MPSLLGAPGAGAPVVLCVPRLLGHAGPAGRPRRATCVWVAQRARCVFFFWRWSITMSGGRMLRVMCLVVSSFCLSFSIYHYSVNLLLFFTLPHHSLILLHPCSIYFLILHQYCFMLCHRCLMLYHQSISLCHYLMSLSFWCHALILLRSFMTVALCPMSTSLSVIMFS